jgi:hypothetical protein
MPPAFTSTKQAAGFALLLLALLLSPLLVGRKLLPPREEAYASQGWGNGPYPWIQDQIFRETNDIDIAFVGSSHILHGVDTPYVQSQLSKKLERPAVVRTIGWGGAGFDGLYFIARDLLSHRRVRMLVFYDEDPAPGVRIGQNTAFFRLGEDASLLRGLDGRNQALFYFASVMGMPRNLLNWVRPNLPAPLVSTPPNYWEQHYGSASIAGLLGATSSELGFTASPQRDDFTKFVPFTPKTTATPADVLTYSKAVQGKFEVMQEPLLGWQLHFVRKLADLARTSGCTLVVLNIPVLDEARVTVIRQRAFWPEVCQSKVEMLGIPPAKLFGGLTDEEVRMLYFNRGHFNKNGMTYFTALITPALLRTYEAATAP